MLPSLRALLVEDSDTDAKLVVRELRRCAEQVHSRRVMSADGLAAALREETWDVILCDWYVPGFGALEALAVMQASGLDVPLILVSGTIGEETAVEAIRAGACDYVLKDHMTRLVPAVLREVREAQVRQRSRESEEKLRLSEVRFARLAESGVIGIAIADIDGRIHEANNAYLQMLGFTREDLDAGAIRWDVLTPPDYFPQAQRAGTLLRETGVAPPWETENFRKDGSRIPLLVAIAMLEAPYCIAVVADLSERRRAEDALRSTEDQLRQAQKMEAIGLLAGGVAHDFNNLLSVILGYSELLLEGLAAEDPLRADLEEIRKAGERGVALTRQLLLFSRQRVIEPTLLDINAIVTNMEKMLRRLMREDVTLKIRLEADLGQCHGDAGLIEQVVMNLAVNARDAMPDGGTLSIETANVQFDDAYALSHLGMKTGDYVMLTVTDNGNGMDKATQARIFEPFFTTKERGKGTGLGLSMVFGIIKQAGGGVHVYSEPGHGATFRIYLPRVDERAVRREAPVAATRRTGHETILLVEDEEQIRMVVKQILARNGYTVLEAAGGPEALAISAAYAQPIHLLLTDITMPQMNGKQLADEIRPLRPGMKVLFMSGYTDGALVGQLASGSAFLQKPMTPAALNEKVRQLLDDGDG